MLNSQMGSLRTLHGNCCFLDESPYECDGLPNTRFGRAILVWGMRLHAGDIVFHGSTAAKCRIFALEDNEFHAIVEVFEEESVVTPSAKIWRVGTGDFRLVLANELDQALYVSNDLIEAFSVVRQIRFGEEFSRQIRSVDHHCCSLYIYICSPEPKAVAWI